MLGHLFWGGQGVGQNMSTHMWYKGTIKNLLGGTSFLAIFLKVFDPPPQLETALGVCSQLVLQAVLVQLLGRDLVSPQFLKLTQSQKAIHVPI